MRSFSSLIVLAFVAGCKSAEDVEVETEVVDADPAFVQSTWDTAIFQPLSPSVAQPGETVYLGMTILQALHGNATIESLAYELFVAYEEGSADYYPHSAVIIHDHVTSCQLTLWFEIDGQPEEYSAVLENGLIRFEDLAFPLSADLGFNGIVPDPVFPNVNCTLNDSPTPVFKAVKMELVDVRGTSEDGSEITWNEGLANGIPPKNEIYLQP